MAASAQIEDVNHRHEAIADLMLSHPELKKGEIAVQLGYTGAWLSAVINSDAFLAYYEKRRVAYTNDLHTRTVDKLYKVAMTAIDKVQERLDETDPDEMPDDRFLIDAKDKALHRLGYGASTGSSAIGQQVVNNLYIADADTLRRAQERMGQVRLQEKKSEEILSRGDGNDSTIDGEYSLLCPESESTPGCEEKGNQV